MLRPIKFEEIFVITNGQWLEGRQEMEALSLAPVDMSLLAILNE